MLLSYFLLCARLVMMHLYCEHPSINRVATGVGQDLASGRLDVMAGHRRVAEVRRQTISASDETSRQDLRLQASTASRPAPLRCLARVFRQSSVGPQRRHLSHQM